ncbi:MAG: signal peptidase I [Firmicutes bacterium]|nr:signal peptidase I [Bacillota bacterium]
MQKLQKQKLQNRAPAQRNLSDELISWARTLGFAVIFALFLSKVVIVNAKVVSGSMENTIMTGDRVAGLRIEYLFENPKRYDIVMFRPTDGGKVPYVKRVIGLPGETVNIRGGKVYITDKNGVEDPVPLDDSFTAEPPASEYAGPFKVPENCYFMLGDNRNHSSDSRWWADPYVPKSDILGRVLCKYYPGIDMLYNH